MQIAVVDETQIDGQNVGATVRTGATLRQSLLADDTPDGFNFTVNRTRWLGGEDTNTTPRHHHAFQQVRWAEQGTVNYGPGQDVPEGDIAYFPRGAWYGPQMRDSGTSITLQFGFNGEKQHGSAYWKQFQVKAMERLKARGTFSGGAFVDTDPATGEKREIDGVHALYEEQYKLATAKEFVVPDEGYDAAILMHPRAFSYFPVTPGVDMKRLGSFYDHPGPDADIRFSMLRLSDAASFDLPADRAQILWSLNAGLRIDEREYPDKTYVYCPLGETGTIAGVDGVELFFIELPRLETVAGGVSN